MQLNKLHKDWLSNRKISPEVLKEFGLFSTSKNLIVIPIFNENGELIFNKYRQDPLKNITPKYLYDKGGKVSLYGYHKAKNSDTILITEGEMDCLVAWSHNIPSVTSTGGAMSFQEEWKDLLKDKEIIICFDNDKAGGEGMAKTIELLGLDKVKIIFLPDRPGIKDISDYVTNGGDLHKLMKTAVIIDDVEEDMAKRIGLWKNTFFHKAYINRHKKPNFAGYKINKEVQDRVERAKQYPITEILFFKKGKTKCIFHKEKTASLNYYPDSNSVYCFGCGKYADSIDVYKAMTDCTFKEAVKKLS